MQIIAASLKDTLGNVQSISLRAQSEEVNWNFKNRKLTWISVKSRTEVNAAFKLESIERHERRKRDRQVEIVIAAIRFKQNIRKSSCKSTAAAAAATLHC